LHVGNTHGAIALKESIDDRLAGFASATEHENKGSGNGHGCWRRVGMQDLRIDWLIYFMLTKHIADRTCFVA
jgi:hypothetical protein